MIVIIVDKRSNAYNEACDAYFEPAYLNNEIDGATRCEDTGAVFCKSLTMTTVRLAIEFGCKNFPEDDVAMFLYDCSTERPQPEFQRLEPDPVLEAFIESEFEKLPIKIKKRRN